MQNWIILIIGGLCEAGWAYCLNRTKVNDKYHVAWLAAFLLLYMLSAGCLAKAIKTIPVGTAYAVWTGIGAFGTICMGIIIFHEPATILRLICLTMIFIAVVGLKFI